MKPFFKWLLKAFVSGILACVILTLFCVFYYNLPVHSSTADGATDYSWEKNKFYSRGTEGFAWGRTNNEGYINSYDYEEGMDIDVLIMGSSHMEGYNVAMEETTASQLDIMLEDGLVYNIGVAGHSFLTCANNLDAALEKYTPKKYVVIETSTLSFSEASLEKAIDGETEELSSHSSGIIGILQKNQLLRLLYSQFSNWSENAEQTKANTSQQNQTSSDYEQLYLTLLSKLSQTAKDHDVELIILYQPRVEIDADTGLAVEKNTETIQKFASYCEETDIVFVDMTQRFSANYNENHILPHGFTNTSVGQGHLNKYGHRMIAEELFKVVGGKNDVICVP